MPIKHFRNGKWTGRWMGSVKSRGRQYRSPLVASRAEAAEWETDKRRELSGPAPRPTTATPSLGEWANEYLDYSVRFAPKTYSEKRGVFRRLFAAGLDPMTSAADYAPGMALAHLQAQYKARSGYAANKDRKTLGAAWNWAGRFMPGWPLSGNPFLAVDRFPEVRRPRRVPTVEDFYRVMDMARGQDRALLTALYCTAARKGELFRWRWAEDVDFTLGRIRLGSRKRRDGSISYAWLPMLDDLRQALVEQQGRSGDCEHVFVQAVGRHKGKPYVENRGFPQELCRAAGVREFGCHGVRHLSATILAMRGVPTVMIQRILRHSKLSTTEAYLASLVGADLRPHLSVIQGGGKGKVATGVAKAKAESC